MEAKNPEMETKISTVSSPSENRDKLERHDINAAIDGKHITLLRVRMILCFCLVPAFAGSVFQRGWIRALKDYRYWTAWSDGNVLFYYLFIFLMFPFSKKKSKFMMVLQHGFYLQQVIVVTITWGVLAPCAVVAAIRGLGKLPDNIWTIVTGVVAAHTFPYFMMLYEFKKTKGKYTMAGVWIGMGQLLAYYIFMVGYLEPVLKFVPYPTVFTDGRTWQSMIMFVVVFAYLYWMGVRTMRQKNKAAEGEELESSVSGDVYVAETL